MRDRRLLAKLALLVGSTVATALFLELGLRAAGYSSQLPYVTYLGRRQVRDPLPGVPYLYPARASFRQVWPDNPRGYFDPEDNGIEYELNNFGFRDDDFLLQRDGKKRVALLGDSFCWGNGVRRRDTLATRLERGLNQFGPDPGYEVYNFCLAGYGSEHEAALYDWVVRHFRPDVVVVWFFLNDVNRPPDRFFDWEMQTAGHWLRGWRSRSRLLDLVVAPIERWKSQRALIGAVNAAYKPGHPGYASLVRAFERLHRVNEEDGVRPYLVVFPWLYALDSGRYPFAGPHRVVRRLAEQQHFTVLDLLPVFAGTPARELWVHPTDQHPNEIAHARAADALLELLRGEMDDGALRVAGNRRTIPPPPPRGGEWWARFAAKPERE